MSHPLPKPMHSYEFGVEMTCNGCSNAVNRVLKRLDGVKNVEISLERQTVHVDADDQVGYQQVHDTIAKTGKRIISGKSL